MSRDARRLGSTGLKVSGLCLGTMTFGLQIDEDESRKILDRALGEGVYFIDTADVYPLGGGVKLAGTTESIIGRWLGGRRERVVLATKCFGATGDMPFDVGNSRKHIFDAVDASLRRLKTDYIDLYQLHRYDPETPIEETLSALEDLIRLGKIRYAGCSNFPAFRVAKANGLASGIGATGFASVQPRYNLLFRVIEKDLMPLCEEDGIGLIPFNPIAGGLLSGKHRFGGEPQVGTRFNSSPASEVYKSRYWNEEMFTTVEELRKIAEGEGISLVTMAVAWVMAHKAVTAPIIGASRVEQLTDSLAAFDYDMSRELFEELNRLTSRYLSGESLT